MKAKNNKKVDKKILLLGFPGNGLIGTFTISYLISHLRMKMTGEINHPDLPPTLFVENGEIISPIRIYKKDNLYAIISDVPVYPEIANEFVSAIAEFCRKNGIRRKTCHSSGSSNSTDMQERR